ncbi:MAG: Ni/Fe hydrogenase subunit gamma [Ignavibacteria bacterium]|nr:Ni/Fe hydrogenase subunit gamma [Ignavibacteria bacterium]
MHVSITSQTMLPHQYRVQRVRQETPDTFTLELHPMSEASAIRFVPGQFNMLYLFGVGEIPISISGDPRKSPTLVHTTRAVGTVTKAMRGLRKGDILGVRGPYGSHWPIASGVGRDIVIIAGGIGLAPLRPTLYSIVADRDKYGRVILLYGSRTPIDILYRRELESWRSRFDLEIYVTVDRALKSWRGDVGVVTHLISKAPFDKQNCLAMICGPEVMMRFAVMELLKRGVPDDRIYISMERNMKCAIGLCGHCQFGSLFVCKDGPVFPYPGVKDLLSKWEI